MKPFALVCFILASVAYDSRAEESLNFTEVAAGVFVFEGEIKDIFASKKSMVSNVAFIIGKQAVAVVDTGASLNQGKLIRQAIRRHTQLPIEYVLNTHVHLDHIFGNQAFVADAPEFIAHKNYAQELAAKGPYYLTRMQAEEFAGSEIVNATRLISKTETINLGDRSIRLIAAQRAHTNHDLMVYDINTATLIAGDLVFVDHCPVIDGSLSG
ncbi:MAG: MBL fold metallo-hydrolase, partial [Pseudomonadales bacterium]